jgi:DNA replication protein DnaC
MSTPEKSRPKPLRMVKGLSDSPNAEQNSARRSQEDSTCPRCFGTGIQVIAGEGARRCDCKTNDSRERLFRNARIPPRYQHCTLTNYEANIEAAEDISKLKAKGEALLVLEHFPDLDGRGLLLIGPVGVGKTHLAVALLHDLIDLYGIRGLFFQFGALLRQIQDSYNPISQTSELSVLQPVFEADVLVLDELGASKPTDWVRDTMMQIINARYNDKRLTIFTTNYSDKRKSEKDTTELLEERIGIPLRSRLYEMCRTVEIEGEDYRKRAAAKNV